MHHLTKLRGCPLVEYPVSCLTIQSSIVRSYLRFDCEFLFMCAYTFFFIFMNDSLTGPSPIDSVKKIIKK